MPTSICRKARNTEMNYQRRFDAKTGGLLSRARAHLRDNRMKYAEHLCFAGKHSVRCVKAAAMLAVHGVMPCFFRRAGSRLVHDMSKDFTEHSNWKADLRENKK